MTKILVQFDGSNFYNKAKKLLPQAHLTNFDYTGFVGLITTERQNCIIYYVGEIRKYSGNKKSHTLYSNQQSLFLNLRKQNVEIKLGYLLLSDGKYHEKGVDVQIACDLVDFTHKDIYDIVVLLSGDVDLLEAVKIAKGMGKHVIIFGDVGTKKNLTVNSSDP
jgi:uncharacterized LabA/DUF88 family protein